MSCSKKISQYMNLRLVTNIKKSLYFTQIYKKIYLSVYLFIFNTLFLKAIELTMYNTI